MVKRDVWTEGKMRKLADELHEQHVNGNNSDVLDYLAGLPPVVACYVGTVIGRSLGRGDVDFWMRVLARRAESVR